MKRFISPFALAAVAFFPYARVVLFAFVAGVATTTFANAQTAEPSSSPSPSPSPVASASPATREYAFTPPKGWTALDLPMTFGKATTLGKWKAPDASTTFATMNLLEEPAGTMQSMSVDVIKSFMARFYGEKNIVKVEKTKACNDTEDAYYSEARFPIGALTMDVEQLIVLGSSNAFVVTYGRSAGSPEDAAARAAMNTLCVTPQPKG